MRDVLVLIHEDAGQESRLQAALSVTRALNGHLTCLDVFVIPLIAADPWTGYTDATVVQTASSDDVTNRALIEKRLGREDVAWTMLNITGDPAEELRMASELADLVVVTSHGTPRSVVVDRAIVGRVVTKANRPVLAVPPECTRFNVSGRALVAWDGSHSANEAVRAAAPLLALAQDVTIFTVNETDGPFPAEDVALYLSRHGVEPRVTTRNTGDPVATTIMEESRVSGADYIVMGAFGHSRAREALFGGVTRTLLENSEIPLLLAH